jgi:hypothetical protein
LTHTPAGSTNLGQVICHCWQLLWYVGSHLFNVLFESNQYVSFSSTIEKPGGTSKAISQEAFPSWLCGRKCGCL